MKNASDCYTLSNGVRIPCIGLGTWQTDGATTQKAIHTALEAGCRLIDTAAAYGNESSVGEAILTSGFKREDIFLTSKLRNACHGYDATLEAFELTLKRLKTDYLDLYLIHWPNPVQYHTTWQDATLGTWKAFIKLYGEGRIRAIGVSNFMPHHIDMLYEKTGVMPMADQLKLCPGITQSGAVDYCREHGILAEAYSPFGTGGIFRSPEMAALRDKYGRSIGQICLRWSLDMGYLPLPKSASPDRIRENLDIFDFTLDKEDLKMITELSGYCGEAPVPDEITF